MKLKWSLAQKIIRYWEPFLHLPIGDFRNYVPIVHLLWIKLGFTVYKCWFLQLKFDGVTSKRMKGRLANPVHRDMKTEKILANQKSCIVKNLSPKTLYTFNISAFYKSGEFGPPQMVRVYTRLLGNVQSVFKSPEWLSWPIEIRQCSIFNIYVFNFVLALNYGVWCSSDFFFH